jgi:hypothetical protein
MNDTQSPVNKIVELINDCSSGVIVLQNNPSVDAIGAATGLYLGLIKAGKNISIACSNPPQSNLIGADKIQTELISGGDNLVISFPYTEGAIDKVDYNIQGNFFNLVIVPRAGYPKIDPDKVNYTYTGGKVDYIITIDAPNLNSLGEVYTKNQQIFQAKNIVNIDRHLINNSFGTINFIDKTSSSTSELIFMILRNLNIDIDNDIATDLYTGLLSATNNFTAYSVNPKTFESASELLRLGAQKKQQNMPPGQPARPMGNFGGSPMMGGQAQSLPQQQPNSQFGPPQQFGNPGMPLMNQGGLGNQGFNQNFPPNNYRPPNDKPIQNVENNPQNWLKPKVNKFNSNSNNNQPQGADQKG